MLFSEHYRVIRNSNDDWFDPLLPIDTKLFVDPFLVFQDGPGRWATAHNRIVDHFNEAFLLLAKCGCDPSSVSFRAAMRMLQFPEPGETCLGYTAHGTGGAGSGKTFAGFMAAAMCDAVGRGVVELRHFEQLDILEEGIGPDRISDIATTILKPELVAYTKEIAASRGIPLVPHKLRAGRFDAMRPGFMTTTVTLPTNPASGGPVLLIPKRFLRDLPAINGQDWWDAARSTELRDEMNADVLKRVDKKTIVRLARRHPEHVEAWIRDREQQRIEPYDLDRDPKGVYNWHAAARRFVRDHPERLANASTHPEFVAVIDRIIERFKHFVEQNGGWRLLWDGEEEKPEEAIQLLFFGMAKSYCEASNIVVDREVELGRGPVDFKFSSGYVRRALLEVKKLENGKFWNGLRAQLPAYLKSDENRDGWLLAVRFRDAGVAEERAQTLASEVKRTAQQLDLDLRWGIVDARPKQSASKLLPGTLGNEGVA